MWLSDRLPAQCRHAEEHQFCLAHLIRDTQFAIDHGDAISAPGFKALLKDACAVGRRGPDLADGTIAAHRRRLEKDLERLLTLKPTDIEGRKLRGAVTRLRRQAPRVPETPRCRAHQQRERPGTAAVGDLAEGHERVPLSNGGPRPMLPSAPLSKPAAATAGGPRRHPRCPGRTPARDSRRVSGARHVGRSNYRQGLKPKFLMSR
jgi:hypothetical protein